MEDFFKIETVNPILLLGVENEKLKSIKDLFPKIKIVARGNLLKITGNEEEVNDLKRRLNNVVLFIEKYGNIQNKELLHVMNDDSKESLEKEDGVILYGVGGQAIKAKTINQRILVQAVYQKDLVFAIGPAGTGKTYTAVALAVRALKNREIKRIVLTRPAVESGENLGFLPGDLKDKLDPYMQPLYDALKDMIPPEKLKEFMENGTVEIAPLAFMRGRTLNNAFVILDEAQNTTQAQLRMFLTRMGKAAKFVVTGDVTQIDLPQKQPSGLIQASEVLKNVDGLQFVYLDKKDIIRHPLVTKIIEAYE